MSAEPSLRRPILIHILALGFIVSPLVNLANALYFGGHPRWFHPAVIVDLYVAVSLGEKLLHLALIGAGIALLLQRKSSWFSAVTILVMTSVYNFFLSEPSDDRFAVLSGLNIFVNASILVVFYYFRFPYLDQRDHILRGLAKRTDVLVEVDLVGIGRAEIKNISKTGCFLVPVGGTQIGSLVRGSRVLIKLASDLEIECEVMHLHNGLGLKFYKPSASVKLKIREILRRS